MSAIRGARERVDRPKWGAILTGRSRPHFGQLRGWQDDEERTAIAAFRNHRVSKSTTLQRVLTTSPIIHKITCYCLIGAGATIPSGTGLHNIYRREDKRPGDENLY